MEVNSNYSVEKYRSPVFEDIAEQETADFTVYSISLLLQEIEKDYDSVVMSSFFNEDAGGKSVSYLIDRISENSKKDIFNPQEQLSVKGFWNPGNNTLISAFEEYLKKDKVYFKDKTILIINDVVGSRFDFSNLERIIKENINEDKFFVLEVFLPYIMSFSQYNTEVSTSTDTDTFSDNDSAITSNLSEPSSPFSLSSEFSCLDLNSFFQ